MKIAIITDAWYPQINGVVRTLDTTKQELEKMGHQVLVISPADFKTIPCPTYPEIRLALFPGRRIRQWLKEFGAESVHIATEGPLGWSARRYCKKRGLPFTTAFHTRFPEYVSARFGAPVSWGYAVMRWFHKPGARVMVSTESLKRELEGRGFGEAALFQRGVDLDLFRPRDDIKTNLPRPIYTYVGRVAVEKSITDFLDLTLDGTKVVVGEGPQLEALRKDYPDVEFPGAKKGDELARYFAQSDVFVFPSRTDTFGLVMLEAMACGVPVAAYSVPGPLDVLGDRACRGNRCPDNAVGCLSEDLGAAVKGALAINRENCRTFAQSFSWEACARQFLDNLEPLRAVDPAPAVTAAA
ncbi:MAG: glycosyltransferase family 4 protein [Alphaproteobacteria bacterium]